MSIVIKEMRLLHLVEVLVVIVLEPLSRRLFMVLLLADVVQVLVVIVLEPLSRRLVMVLLLAPVVHDAADTGLHCWIFCIKLIRTDTTL